MAHRITDHHSPPTHQSIQSYHCNGTSSSVEDVSLPLIMPNSTFEANTTLPVSSEGVFCLERLVLKVRL